MYNTHLFMTLSLCIYIHVQVYCTIIGCVLYTCMYSTHLFYDPVIVYLYTCVYCTIIRCVLYTCICIMNISFMTLSLCIYIQIIQVYCTTIGCVLYTCMYNTHVFYDPVIAYLYTCILYHNRLCIVYMYV